MERSELLLDTAKFEGVFDSISTTLVQQTSVLRSMYNLDVKKLELDKEAKKDAARDRALKVDEAAVQTQTQSNDSTSTDSSFSTVSAGASSLTSGLAALVGGALGGMSIAGIGAMVVKGGFLALVAPKIGDFISGAVNETLNQANPPDAPGDGTAEFNKSISDGIGDAFTYGFIGRLFGKRVAAIAAVGGFVGSFSEEIIKKFGNEDNVIDEFGMEFDETAVSNILKAIGAAIALITPSLIRRALPRILSRNMVRPAVVGAVAGAAAIDGSGNRVDPRPRNFTRQADGSFTSNRTGETLRGGALQNAQRTYDSDQDLMRRLDNSKYAKFAKFAKGAGALGSVISIGYLASILLNEEYTDAEKTELIGGELGAIFGGVNGAVLAAGVGAAMGITSGPGAIITAIGGGIAGAVAGDWLGSQIAGMIVGSKTDFDEVPADVRSTLPLMDTNALPLTSEPRPTYSGQQGDYDRNDWDNTLGKLYNPDGTLKPEFLLPNIPESVEPIMGPDQVISRQRRLQSLESNAMDFGQAQASVLLAEGAKVYRAGNNSSVTNVTNITKIDSSSSLANNSGVITAFG